MRSSWTWKSSYSPSKLYVSWETPPVKSEFRLPGRKFRTLTSMEDHLHLHRLHYPASVETWRPSRSWEWRHGSSGPCSESNWNAPYILRRRVLTMSDHAESPTESQHEEPSVPRPPIAADSATPDQDKKSMGLLMPLSKYKKQTDVYTGPMLCATCSR